MTIYWTPLWAGHCSWALCLLFYLFFPVHAWIIYLYPCLTDDSERLSNLYKVIQPRKAWNKDLLIPKSNVGWYQYPALMCIFQIYLQGFSKKRQQHYQSSFVELLWVRCFGQRLQMIPPISVPASSLLVREHLIFSWIHSFPQPYHISQDPLQHAGATWLSYRQWKALLQHIPRPHFWVLPFTRNRQCSSLHCSLPARWNNRHGIGELSWNMRTRMLLWEQRSRHGMAPQAGVLGSFHLAIPLYLDNGVRGCTLP